MRCLVTGGLGFIGSNLAIELSKHGHDVHVTDIDTESENIAEVSQYAKVHHYNILNESGIMALLQTYDIETIFHLAALPRVQYSIAYPMESNETNITGTLNLLECARKCGVKRFVYSASSSAYGDQDTLPLVETMKENPMSPYALQKFAGEKYCNLYYITHGLETVSLRYFNVFGPRQSVESAYGAFIPKFISAYLNNERPTVFGDGEQSRDFNYIDNIVSANLLAAFTQDTSVFGDVYNVGACNQVSVNQVDQMIRDHLGTDLKPIYGDPVIEPKHTKADLTKSEAKLNYSVLVNFEKGLQQTIDWFKNKK